MPSINTELGERALSKMQHEMDWKPLKERCLRAFPSWSSRHVDRVLREYHRFLALKVATRDIYDTIVLAPMYLDVIWKQHILSTQQYYADCQLLLQANQILHYNADASINVRSSVREKRMELTKASLCMMFSGMYPLSSDAKGIWDYDEIVQEHEHAGVLSTAGDPEDTTDEFNTGTEEEEEDATELDIINMEPSKPRSPRKQGQRKAKVPTKAQSMDNSVDNNKQRRVLYIYRSGKVFKLSIHAHDTIANVKAKIHRKTGISSQQQFLEWDGLALENKRTVSHYGIPDDATLVLTKVRRKDQEIVSPDMRKQGGHADLDDSSPEERDQPEDRRKRHGESAGRRTGSPNRRRPQEAPLSPRSPRPPKPPRKQKHPYSPTMHPSSREDDSLASTSVHSALITKRKLQSRETHHDPEDSSIEPDSTLASRPRPKSSHTINVFINTIMGFTINLTAKASDTVEHLKHLVEEQEEIPSRKQILILEGVPLVDSQYLCDYTSTTSLHVLLRLQAGSSSVTSIAASSVMTPTGTSNMATITRKMNQDKILSRTTVVGSTVDHDTGVGPSKWR